MAEMAIAAVAQQPVRSGALNLPLAVALGAGGGLLASCAHPPLALWPAAPLGMAAFALAVVRAPHARAATVAGLAFGCGLWLPVLGWLYTGVRSDDAPLLAWGMPSVLIGSLVCASAFAARLAWSLRAHTVAAMLLLTALWIALEWSRQFGAFRFPWARLGYTQIDGPLAGFAPLVGVLGVGALAIVLGSALALAVLARRPVARLGWVAVAAAILLGGNGLQRIEWTRDSQRSVAVAALQGAFAYQDKFDAEAVSAALELYGRFALESAAQVSIVPETALPVFEHQLPASYLAQIHDRARTQGRDVLLGLFRVADVKPAAAAPAHYNSARILGTSGAQNYDKRILLPFGEYVPAARWLRPWFERIASVPMLDTAAGTDTEAALWLGGERIALRLCFEDLFGGFARVEAALAGYLVVLANDSWDGSTLPMQQHLQVARMRALEAQKPLVRVANTGWSGLIGADGRLLHSAPSDERAELRFDVRPRHGATPYLRHGDLPVLAAVALALLYCAAAGRALKLHARAA